MLSPTPRQDLDRLAYLCGASLIRQYKARLKDDDLWDDRPRACAYKKWASAAAVFLVLVFSSVGLTEWPAHQVRGLLNLTEFAEDKRPITRPLSHVVWNRRGKLHNEEPAPYLERFGLAFVSGNTGLLGTRWLAELPSGDDSQANPALWAYMNPEDVYPQIPDLAPERLSPFTETGGEALDETGAPLRWNPLNQSCELNPELQNELMARLEAWEKQQQAYSRALQARAERYQRAVEHWSRKYNLNPDLLYAIIYTESSFNPLLVSSRDAHGLMQVVPGTAGGEVKAWLGEKGVPTSEELLDPATNIQYGAAYFRLLLKRHFPRVKDALSREYCALAAYNAGSGSVFRVFGRTREEAVAAINELNADEVLDALLTKSPARETRGFLRKVIASRTHFVAMN